MPLTLNDNDPRVIAARGAGLSEGMDHNSVDIRQFAVATLHTMLQAFNLEDADIVAHSMGAHWSLWLAMDRPHQALLLTLRGALSYPDPVIYPAQ